MDTRDTTTTPKEGNPPASSSRGGRLITPYEVMMRAADKEFDLAIQVLEKRQAEREKANK